MRRALFYGTGDRWFKVETGKYAGLQFQWKGFDTSARRSLATKRKRAYGAGTIDRCRLFGLRRQSLDARTSGSALSRIDNGDIVRLSLVELHRTIRAWTLDEREQKIAGEVLAQILARTEFLLDVGLDYLSLSRAANSLSGGESQRIRLASQLGSGLCGVMYVLDEPTIGLHPRDNNRLLTALNKLRDLGTR